jgi:hypothetical protein
MLRRVSKIDKIEGNNWESLIESLKEFPPEE